MQVQNIFPGLTNSGKNEIGDICEADPFVK